MANILDNFIGWLSPEAAYKRQAYRNALELQKSYDAGTYSKQNQNWRVFNESAEAEDCWNRDIVRARARDLEKNSDVMNSVIGAYKRNVFGRGYRLRSMTGDESLNEELEKAWLKWCKKRNCDVTGTQNLDQMLRMCVERKKVDGGVILLKRYTSDGMVPFQLQALEVDELDALASTPGQKGNKVVGGIEYNAWNKPVAYFFRRYSTDGYTVENTERVDAKDVIFMYSKRRPSQIREMSDMSPTITRIRDINEFIRSVSVKERVLACLSVFIKRALPPSLGRSNLADGGNSERYQGKMLTPGMIQYLNPGDEVQTVIPAGAATDATQFIKQQMRMTGSGQGLSYETVSRDMSESNYSSARQGVIEDEMTYQEDVEMLIDALDEIYETFVISCVLSGAVQIRNFWTEKETYLEHKWIKAPKKWIDPAKEANANKTALQTGEKTFAELAAEHGRDWREQIDEMAEIQEYAAQKGVIVGGTISGNTK